jgi:hypothetical protein
MTGPGRCGLARPGTGASLMIVCAGAQQIDAPGERGITKSVSDFSGSQLPAGASTASAQKAAAVAVPAVTDCPVVPGNFSIYNSNCSGRHNYGCSSGNQNTLAYPPLYVSNGCPYRVWIYQGPGKTGYSLCITNGTKTNRLGRVYDYFWVSSNHNAC